MLKNQYVEPSPEVLMARKKVTQRLMQLNPIDWTEKDKQEWLSVGFKLPKSIDPTFKKRKKYFAKK